MLLMGSMARLLCLRTNARYARERKERKRVFSQFDFEKHGFTEPSSGGGRSKDTYSVIAEYVDGSTEALCEHKAFAEPDRYWPVVFGHVPAWHFSYLPYTWRVWVVYDPHQSIVGLWYFVREATFPYGQGSSMHVLRQDRHQDRKSVV